MHKYFVAVPNETPTKPLVVPHTTLSNELGYMIDNFNLFTKCEGFKIIKSGMYRGEALGLANIIKNGKLS